jgi:hypothetical protein
MRIMRLGEATKPVVRISADARRSGEIDGDGSSFELHETGAPVWYPVDGGRSALCVRVPAEEPRRCRGRAAGQSA